MAEGGQVRSKTSHRTKAQASRQWQETRNRPGVREKNKARMEARRKMIKAGVAARGDGKDVDHKDGTMNNARSNLRMQSPSKNRAHSKEVAARGGRATKKKPRRG